MDAYLQLFLKGIKTGSHAGNASVVAFTSTLPGEGVSYVTQSFAVKLAKRTKRKTVVADVDTLQKIDIFHHSQVARHCCSTNVPNLYVLDSDEDEFPDIIEETTALSTKSVDSEIDRGLSNLQTLRFMFDF